MLWKLRARIGYQVARWLMRFPKLVAQPRAWQWMQGQYSRMAALGDVPAQSFYGHLLLHRGHGFGAREEGIRLLRVRDHLVPSGRRQTIRQKLIQSAAHRQQIDGADLYKTRIGSCGQAETHSAQKGAAKLHIPIMTHPIN